MGSDDGDSGNEARRCNQQWRIREESDDYQQDLYPCYPELFWIKVHHGGVFSEFPHRVYQCGKVDYVDLCNRDIPFRFGELKNIARKLGYDDACNLFFHYLIPGDDIDLGLRELSNDLNAVSMLKHLGKEHELSLYIEVGEILVNRKEDVFDKEQKVVIDAVFNDFFIDGGRKTKEDGTKCPWVLYVSKLEEEPTWVVKTYNPQHKCLQSRSIKAFTAGWLSKQILFEIETNPGIPVKSLQEQMQRKFEMGVSKMKAFRAKSYATKEVTGDYIHQYSNLREYALELLRTNPGSTIKFEFEAENNPEAESRVFKRIYICLGPLKEGFKACRREIIGLDGAFMKGPFPGQLLTAVGVDPNNGIYPIAYSIVESECLDSWEWFLLYLRDDLDLDINSNYTFISDRQKGLIPALQKVFPYVEHRYCVRHINQNMQSTCRGKAYKDMLWSIASASTIPEFNAKMDELKSMNVEAYQFLQQIPAKHWSRSHFTGYNFFHTLGQN